jgi:hypothetical protein
MVRTTLCLLAVALVYGCWQPYHRPEIERTKSPIDGHIEEQPKTLGKEVVGIIDMLARDDVQHVDVLMIHGMCQHGNGWVEESFNSLLSELPDNKKVKKRRLVRDSIAIAASYAAAGRDRRKILLEDDIESMKRILNIHGDGKDDSELTPLEIKRLNELLMNSPVDAETREQREIIIDICDFHKQTRLYSQRYKINNKSLWLHAIVWSPVTTPLKRELCYDIHDRDKPVWKQCDAIQVCRQNAGVWKVDEEDKIKPYKYQRAILNASLKEKLMNDCISDAFVYLGDQREEIQAQVALALIQAAGIRGGDRRQSTGQFNEDAIDRAAREKAPIILISESLGSKVLFDTLLMMISNVAELKRLQESAAHAPEGKDNLRTMAAAGEGNLLLEALNANGVAVQTPADLEAIKNAGLRTVERTVQVFLGSNQIPLLSLSEKDVLVKLIKQIEREFPAWRDRFSIAAFSDPGDLFSYTLKDSGYADNVAKAGVPVIDVVVSNSASWMGIIEWPNVAHEGYRTNNDVKRTILCGIPEREDCPVEPDRAVKDF